MRKEKEEELKKYIQEFQTIEVIPKKKRKNPFLKLIHLFIKKEFHFLTIETSDYKLNNGKTITREKILKNNKDGDAVIIVPITKDNECIMVIEPRVHTREQVGIGFPAGYVEKNESKVKAAERELQEETGYQAENVQEIDSFYQDEGCSSAYNTIVLATGCVKVSKQMLDESEFIHYFLCSMEEAYELLERGYIQGVNTKLALLQMKKILK